MSAPFPSFPTRRTALAALILFTTACRTDDGALAATAPLSPSDPWRHEFQLEGRRFETTGRNAFFVLEPGYQLVLAHGGDRLTITVLDETERVGDTLTRVVEERELSDGELEEVSRNYFAIDAGNGDVFYFGESVDTYEDGVLDGHPGGWRADEPGRRPGLLMLGKPTVGARYYQEIAPGQALDRAEVMALEAELSTPAGHFTGCLRTLETTPLEPHERETKLYAPGIGLVQEEQLQLVSHGVVAR